MAETSRFESSLKEYGENSSIDESEQGTLLEGDGRSHSQMRNSRLSVFLRNPITWINLAFLVANVLFFLLGIRTAPNIVGGVVQVVPAPCKSPSNSLARNPRKLIS